jgi:uncharacterized protein (TIGR03437 family)
MLAETSNRSVMTMKIVRVLLVLSAAVSPAAAQTSGWDNSGNKMLNGTYYFRHVIYQLSNSGDGSLADAASMYGTATFSGTGTYTMNVTLADLSSGQLQQGAINNQTYSIAASGQGFLTNPLFSGDYIFGLVNQQGIFVGSSTENVSGYHDLFIAAPLASPNPTASTFKGTYSMAYMDLSGEGSFNPLYSVGALAQMSPDGNGNLGTVSLGAYVGGNGSSKISQSLSNVKYIFSNGAAVMTFPNSNSALFSGQYYLYFSPDGNFVFGGSPVAADMFVGVRTGTGTPNLSGLYYEGGLDEDESTLSNGYANPDSFYGSLSANSGVIVGHQRLLSFFNNSVLNYTYSDSYNLAANGTYSNPSTNYVVGADGIRIASGIGPYLSLSVALPAPTPSPSIAPSGVFLNPTGVVNAGSSAPFTAGIAPGELLTLYGSNLSSGTQVASSVPFPTNLNNVQVKINGISAPIYYVTPTQLSAIVPYAVQSGVAQIQVINNGATSNTVTMQVATTAAGVLTQLQNGLGYGDAVHQDGTLVNAQHPAQIGETVSIFLTGLGMVNPLISDGAAGPDSPLSLTTNIPTAYVGGTQASLSYAGLAPELAGLYQINMTIPSGLTTGDNNLDISGPDSYTSECLIAIGNGSATTSAAEPRAQATAFRAIPRSQSPGRMRALAPRKSTGLTIQ